MNISEKFNRIFGMINRQKGSKYGLRLCSQCFYINLDPWRCNHRSTGKNCCDYDDNWTPKFKITKVEF